MQIILFLIIIAFLVVVHELGHFLAAKISKIKVDEFAIGFPPKIWGKKIGETLYSLNALPFGGFVKILGENSSEKISKNEIERSFSYKGKLTQIFVLVAGVFMNALTAFVLFFIAIVIGLPAPAGYAGDKTLLNEHIMVRSVAPKSPADVAGIKPLDQIKSISYGGIDRPKEISVESVQKFISQHENITVKVTVLRGGEEKEFEVIPKKNILPDRATLGVELARVGVLKLSPTDAFFESAKITVYAGGTVALGLYEIIKNALLGAPDLSEVAGPVGIVSMVGDAANIGFSYTLGFIALISINLAVLNLLPFPALDGGRILFIFIESIFRRKINPAIENALNFAGFAILVVLMVIVTYHDLLRIF